MKVIVRRRTVRRVLTIVLVAGSAMLIVGIARDSDWLTGLGVVLTLPQTLESARNLWAPSESPSDLADARRALARRMLIAHQVEEVTPSIPGGGMIELVYRADAELVTFRSQDSGSVGFHDLVASVKCAPGPLVLIGAPGSGKSMTVRRLIVEVLGEAVSGLGDDALAERFSLSRWDRRLPLDEWLAQMWSSHSGYELDIGDAQRLVADPSSVLALDGLDEVGDQMRCDCVAAINAFIDVHPSTRLIICCREEEYQALDSHVESGRVRRIVPLESEAIGSFLAAHAPPTWDTVRAALVHDADLRSLLSRPLFLVAALRGLREDPSVLLVGSQRERQDALWDWYVTAMLRSGDQSLGAAADRRRWLENVAITMVATGTNELGSARPSARVARRAAWIAQWLRWIVARRSVDRPMPARLRQFLDDCVDRHLLRRSAYGYQCFHRHLLGYLVSQASFSSGNHALRQRVVVPLRSAAWGWNRLAVEALAAGRSDVAATMARRALELAPRSPIFLNDLAFYLTLTRQLHEAVALAEQAEAASPEDWRPPSTAAYALFALGDPDGSARARRRAWVKGHQPSDGVHLVHVLDRLGRHTEATTVLAELRAVEHDNALATDRVLALSTVDRSRDALTALLPLGVEEENVALMFFSAPTAVGASLLPGDAFEIVELEPGTIQIILGAVDVRNKLWGSYREISVGLHVRPAGAPEDTIGAFILGSPTTERFDVEPGYRSLAFPTTTAEIDVDYTSKDVTFRLTSEGGQAFRLRVPRLPPRQDPERVETTVYTYVGGIPYATRVEIDIPVGVVDDLSAISIEVGAGPLADTLRRLGLPKVPDYCAWGEGLSAVYHLPRPVVTDRPWVTDDSR